MLPHPDQSRTGSFAQCAWELVASVETYDSKAQEQALLQQQWLEGWLRQDFMEGGDAQVQLIGERFEMTRRAEADAVYILPGRFAFRESTGAVGQVAEDCFEELEELFVPLDVLESRPREQLALVERLVWAAQVHERFVVEYVETDPETREVLDWLDS